MKKLLLVFVMAVIIAAGTAFADHPGGLGIGIQAGGGPAWYGGAYGNVALSLKLPQLPIFWTADLNIRSRYFGLGVSGDYYLIDKPIVKDIFLHWYLGVGAGVSMAFWKYDYIFASESGANFTVLGRLPIGIDFQIPLDAKPLNTLEIYLQIVPSLGISFGSFGYNDSGIRFPAGGLPVNIGLRLWFDK